MMISRLLFFTFLVHSLAADNWRDTPVVQSPDGGIAFYCGTHGDDLSYAVRYQGRTVIEPSALGFLSDLGNLSTGLKLQSTATRRVEQEYELPGGKTSTVHSLANEWSGSWESGDGHQLTLIVRISDRDVAFCYEIHSETAQRLTLTEELTRFRFASGTHAYLSHQVPWGGGYMKTKPSYEEGYAVAVPTNHASPHGLGFTFPALFQTEAGDWVLLSETGVSGSHLGARLSDYDPELGYQIAFPEPEENAGLGEATLAGSLPYRTAWRTLTIGDTLAPIVESTVATDVVEPLYEASMDYQPGRSTWSWILWQDASMNWDDQVAYIDLAAEMGYEYILVDAFWDQNIGRERMPELVAYANEKGVDVLLWYNSNGYWNDAPQTPRDCMHTAPARHREMQWLQSIGVKGLKVDFFGGDKQVTLKLYEDILTDANTYGLHLNFHGATLPRGWERMYPNFMTSEAVTASENLVFSQGFADNEARLSTLISFIRNPVAAMDYGPVFLNKRFGRHPDQGNVRRTTDAFQLATAVLYHSPMQHFGLTPDNLQDQPAPVLEFLKAVPSAWDETRYVAGHPGEFVVLARRSGETWYIAATHAGTEVRELSVDLPWLAGASVTLLEDEESGSVSQRSSEIPEHGRVNVKLQPNGGVVMTARQ